MGFMYQLRTIGFGLPFPLNILFIPFRIVEWLLTMVVAWDDMHHGPQSYAELGRGLPSAPAAGAGAGGGGGGFFF